MRDASETHRLDGLEPDNLLAFLALLGLLRALDTARPDWRARACWETAVPPLRPVLRLGVARVPREIAAAAGEGVATLARAHRFDRDDIAYTTEEARVLLAQATGAYEAAVLAALFSDGAAEDGKVWPSPLCFLFGQGHQHFLSRLATIPAGTLPKKLEKLRRPPDLTDSAYIAAALFEPWTRGDPTDGLRWDPAEDRRYALRAVDPSADPAGMQHGANRLAAIGLPALPGVAIRRRGTRFLNLATSYGGDGTIRVTWPIWTRPARLTGIRALLSHPVLSRDEPEAMRALPDVELVFRARRMSVGKFFNVTVAERVA